MSGETISSYTNLPVTVLAAYQDPLLVAATGTIRTAAAYGVYVAPGLAAQVVNDGQITATSSGSMGVAMGYGGSLTNSAGASIRGDYYGVHFTAGGTGTITNAGTITAGSTLAGRGRGVSVRGNADIVNGSATDTSALIAGNIDGIVVFGTAATVANFGTIEATGLATNAHAITYYGVYLRIGGSVTNGSASDTSALVTGSFRGVEIAVGVGTVVNYGTISSPGGYGRGVALSGGGTVTNGSATDTLASITGGSDGVYLRGPAGGSVMNFGTIATVGTAGQIGVLMQFDGSITNGSAADSAASISGISRGVFINGQGPGTVTNFGTISAVTGPGVDLYLGGSVTNGSNADTAARIVGYQGVELDGWTGSTLANFGTITTVAGGASRAVGMLGGGVLINGSATDHAALIYGGGDGAVITGGVATVTNFGTIAGATGLNFYRNAGAGRGFTGTGTVINAGTIESTVGTAGVAIRLGSGVERVVLDGGSTLIGRIVGGSGSNTLELAAGTGTLYGLANFSGFGTILVDTGATWTLSGRSQIAAGATLTDAGSLIVAGTMTNSGDLQGGVSIANGATLINWGTLGGPVQLGGPNALLIDEPGSVIGGSVGGTGRLELAQGTRAGTLSGLGSVIAGFATAQVDARSLWTMTGANSLAAGVDMTINGTLTLAGQLANHGSIAGALTVASGGYLFNAAGAAMSWGPVIDGRLVNAGSIASRVTLGSAGTVINQAGGVIGGEVFGIAAAGTVANAGTILATNGVSVSLATGTGRVIVDPGAVFSGRVTGGGGASTLELAGGGAGSLAGLGAGMTNFGTIAVDTGANW